MMDFIFSQVFFLLALVLVMWVPGWAWVRFLERKGDFLSAIERVSVIVSLSIVSTDAVMLLLGRVGVPLEGVSVSAGIVAASAVLFALSRRGRSHDSEKKTDQKISAAFLVVFGLAMFIKMIYLAPNIVPSSTDLGHHMYWVKKIVLDKKLPVYEERDIELGANGHYTIGEPKPISDFIIGEHLALGALAMISGKGVTSSFSIGALFAIHVATLLSVYALARRLFEKFSWSSSVGVWALFFYGVLYALGQSQLRFVAGGVAGNTIGNLFIPVIFLLLVLAIRQKRIGAFVTALVLMFALAYTHHLSTLMLLMALVGTLGAIAFLQKNLYRDIFSLIRSRQTAVALLCFGVFFFLVYTPSYIRNAAVEQVVGTAEHEEHLGMDFLPFTEEVGAPRVALALVGLAFLFAMKKTRRTDSTALLLGWTIVLSLAVLYPAVFRVDLPSARVANYLAVPLSILSGAAIFMVARQLERHGGLSRRMVGVTFIFLLLLVAHSGFADDNNYLKFRAGSRQQTLELAHAAEYLSGEIPRDMTVMHDHINIPGDSWIKLAFMRDYNYPFYRALLFRYERADDRQEKCTLYVVTDPDSPEAIACRRDLRIGAVLVNEQLGGQQFERAGDFSKVYDDAFQAIYARTSAFGAFLR